MAENLPGVGGIRLDSGGRLRRHGDALAHRQAVFDPVRDADSSSDAKPLSSPDPFSPRNRERRGEKPSFKAFSSPSYFGKITIVPHYTDGSPEGAVATFQMLHNTSAHYIIGRDGTVVQMFQEDMGAFHVSCFANRGYCFPTCPICYLNGKFVEPYLQSIGIELVNNGHVDPDSFHGSVYEDYQNAFGYRFWEDYPPAQIATLKVLVQDIRSRWSIPWDMVIGHYRVNHKVDPGPALNLFWPRFGSPSAPPYF